MDGSRKQTEDCGERIAPHAPPSPGGAFHTPNRGPRIRITRGIMQKYRKKPVVIEAVQWWRDGHGNNNFAVVHPAGSPHRR